MLPELTLLLALLPAAPPNYTPTPEELQAAFQRAQQPPGKARVYKDRITPHWFANETRFWYRNDLPGRAKEFVLVEADAGKRGPAFDHAKLAAALTKAADKKYQPDRLPFDSIEFVNDNKSVKFAVGGTTWTCDLTTYECVSTGSAAQRRANTRGCIVASGIPGRKRPGPSPRSHAQ